MIQLLGPRACYDEGKRVSETLTYAYAKQENMQVRVARIFNTYGPRMHMNDGRVVSNFILQALQDDVITVSKIKITLPSMLIQLNYETGFDNYLFHCHKEQVKYQFTAFSQKDNQFLNNKKLNL